LLFCVYAHAPSFNSLNHSKLGKLILKESDYKLSLRSVFQR